MVAASGCLTYAQQALHEAEAPSGTEHYETRRGDGAQDAKRLGSSSCNKLSNTLRICCDVPNLGTDK